MHQRVGPQTGHRSEWKVVKELPGTPVPGGFGVRVSMLEGFRPRYSVQVGTYRKDGVFTPHLPVETEGVYQISLKSSLTKDLIGLLTAAEEWLLEEAALRASDSLDKRIEKENKDANYGKTQTRVTGKTAKKKARQKQAA